MKTGDQITILKPVSPHIEGNGTITKVDEGKLKYEVEQWDIKQWYEENQITDRLITIEPAPEFPKNICDQYKEAISEATEDIKGCITFANGSSNQTSTAVPFMGGTTTGGPYSILGRPYIPETIANYTKEQSALIKKALALLAEQKQSEIKEIEELIKKL